MSLVTLPFVLNSFLYISIITIPYKQLRKNICAKIIEALDVINNNEVSWCQ